MSNKKLFPLCIESTGGSFMVTSMRCCWHVTRHLFLEKHTDGCGLRQNYSIYSVTREGCWLKTLRVKGWGGHLKHIDIYFLLNSKAGRLLSDSTTKLWCVCDLLETRAPLRKNSYIVLASSYTCVRWPSPFSRTDRRANSPPWKQRRTYLWHWPTKKTWFLTLFYMCAFPGLG